MNRIMYNRLKKSNKIKYAPPIENINAIKSADWEVLRVWYKTLNSWGWPKELNPVVKDLIDYEPNQRREQLMCLIEDKVGEKFLLYKWNVHERGSESMSESEFEDWWKNRLK